METGKNILPVVLQIEESIATIRFNRPEALNAIDLGAARALRSQIKEIRSTSGIRAVILKGSGRGFVAGGDLAYFKQANRNASYAARRVLEPLNEAVQTLAEMPCPVIASVHGPVAGAGMSLAMIADLCIAAKSSKFNLAYARIGNSLDCSASWTLPRLVGLRKAMEIALLCDTLSADDAEKLGIVNFVVSDDELESQTMRLASRVARMPPLAAAAIKRQLNASFQRSLKEQLDSEMTSFIINARSMDFIEGVSAFLEKREPEFVGL